MLDPSRPRQSAGFEWISSVFAWSSEIIAAALEEIILEPGSENDALGSSDDGVRAKN
jgi:hypothetical protein